MKYARARYSAIRKLLGWASCARSRSARAEEPRPKLHQRLPQQLDRAWIHRGHVRVAGELLERLAVLGQERGSEAATGAIPVQAGVHLRQALGAGRRGHLAPDRGPVVQGRGDRHVVAARRERRRGVLDGPLVGGEAEPRERRGVGAVHGLPVHGETLVLRARPSHALELPEQGGVLALPLSPLLRGAGERLDPLELGDARRRRRLVGLRQQVAGARRGRECRRGVVRVPRLEHRRLELLPQPRLPIRPLALHPPQPATAHDGREQDGRGEGQRQPLLPLRLDDPDALLRRLHLSGPSPLLQARQVRADALRQLAGVPRSSLPGRHETRPGERLQLVVGVAAGDALEALREVAARGAHDDLLVAARVGRQSRQDLAQDRPEGEHVGALVDVLDVAHAPARAACSRACP